MTDLERVLDKAQYTALPLPRERSAPTTVYSFHDGQLFVVRNPHTCLPDPPLSITEDRAVDTLTFQREFSFNFKGIVSFFIKILNLGHAKAELEAKDVSSATVEMGGLQHETIQTGDMIDFLMTAPRDSRMRDLTNKDNFTIIAALKASTFTYTFRNSKGATVNLSLPEAEGLFKTDASVAVSVTNDGKIVVNAPRYVGVVSWKGDTISKELGKARKFAQGFGAVGYEAPRVFAVAATAADIERVREATLPGRGAQLRAKAPSKTTARSKSRSATRRRMDLVR